MHLSYCTNVHPAEDLDGVLDQLARSAGPVRRAAGLNRLGIGLWLPSRLAHRLDASAADRDRLRVALHEHGLEVRTLNAFPAGGFHADVVGRAVYRPDWTRPERLAYTLACARVLADLLPTGADGSVSTLPLGWRTGWTASDDEAATRALATLSAELRALAERSGVVVRLAVEPEPGCVLDTVDDVVGWLGARTGADRPATARIDPALVGVCLDTCHLAVSFADPAAAVRRITGAGLRVVKVQASAALHVADPAAPAARDAVRRFAEPRYLHQTRELGADGRVHGVDDLTDALAGGLPGRGPWRVHFHVPLHHDPAPPLAATTDVLRESVAAVAAAPHGEEAHLDVETYTWSVLPPDVLPSGTDELVAGIAAELRWAADHLTARDTVLTPAGRSTP
ncbi:MULTISPECIES: metabolite traffic protein EboE [unclassified Isoptericola]|uniref:metabolite traffic protein EboE n=1 Tax=unclassified Isoptericola TaxID=2623355 RepID=UPI002713AA6B|nr:MULTISPECIES: metabolite traffic protein EboE [unclassified Isoptericola]MDO8145510.1 metabolite traffic protein EboE [Isoptericola sp. 178]MDO8149151.1 metabolite traffic protein EboE [Isoptericola sp. b515]